MRTKILLPTILLIAAIFLSACSGTIQFGQQQPRTINVTGNAQVILSPDIAYISIGVHSEAQSAKDAVTSNNTLSQAVIDAIKAQGGQIVCGGRRIERPGCFVEPTIVKMKQQMPIVCEETFAPILYLMVAIVAVRAFGCVTCTNWS